MEIDLLKKYPKTERNLNERSVNKTDEDRDIARKFGYEFFDGDRRHGYGGFNYNPKYWSEVVKDFMSFYKLNSSAKILDIGCARGFMLYDFKNIFPNLQIFGIDISYYAISTSKKEIKENLIVGDAINLPFKDNEFDLVISINTIHNLEKNLCAKALNEINRVTKQYSYLTVDAYRNDEEKSAMFSWNLTAKTIMSDVDWKNFFIKNNYRGDYFWFIP